MNIFKESLLSAKVEQLEKNFSKLKLPVFETEDLEFLKKQILSILNDNIDYDTLQTVLSVLRKKDIENLISDLCNNKKIKKYEELIFNKFILIKGEFFQKIKILRYLTKKSMIDLKVLEESNDPIKLEDILIVDKEISKDLVERLFFSIFDISEGNGKSLGKGEIALTFFINGAEKSNIGDVKIGPNNYLEVKMVTHNESTGGKLYDGKGNSEPKEVLKRIIQPELEKLGIKINKPGDVNFTKKEVRIYHLLKNNTDLSQKEILKFIEKIINEIHESKEFTLKKFYNKDNLTDKEIIREIQFFELEDYLRKKNKNGMKTDIVFINKQTKKLFLINKDNYKERFEKLTITNSIDFGGNGKSATYRYAIK